MLLPCRPLICGERCLIQVLTVPFTSMFCTVSVGELHDDVSAAGDEDDGHKGDEQAPTEPSTGRLCGVLVALALRSGRRRGLRSLGNWALLPGGAG